MLDWFLRAASSAASFTRLDRSAPLNPGVSRATTSIFISLESGLPATCTFRIASRPATSGRSSVTLRSKRPGRSSAGSRISGRLVAAITMMLVFVSNPSISTRIWFSVCSRSSCPPPSPAPRCRPTASISSTNMMHGALRFACSNRSRTRAAPTPTNISTNSLPEMWKNGTPASPATALASRVFPVPGGPTSSTPFGILAPSWRKRSGYLRNSTTSSNSALASSTPATSLNVTDGRLNGIIRARLRPKLIVWLLEPCACRIISRISPPKKINGRKFSRIPNTLPNPLDPLYSTSGADGPSSAPWSESNWIKSVFFPIRLEYFTISPPPPDWGMTVNFSPSTMICLICPPRD